MLYSQILPFESSQIKNFEAKLWNSSQKVQTVCYKYMEQPEAGLYVSQARKYDLEYTRRF